jgi:hypothetical protein
MMRMLLCLIVFVTLAGGSVALARGYNGPGWYIHALNMETGDELVAGPYGTFDECDAQLPDDTEDREHFCQHHTSDPWP